MRFNVETHVNAHVKVKVLSCVMLSCHELVRVVMLSCCVQCSCSIFNALHWFIFLIYSNVLCFGTQWFCCGEEWERSRMRWNDNLLYCVVM